MANKNTLIYVGLGVAALYLFSRGRSASAASPAAPLRQLPMAPVRAGELISAKTFQQIGGRRPGFFYVAARMNGGLLMFTATVSGNFTRNVVKEGSQLWAEMRR